MSIRSGGDGVMEGEKRHPRPLLIPRLGSAGHVGVPQLGPKTVEPVLAVTAGCNRLAGCVVFAAATGPTQDQDRNGEEVMQSAFVAKAHCRCKGVDEASTPCLTGSLGYGSLDT